MIKLCTQKLVIQGFLNGKVKILMIVLSDFYICVVRMRGLEPPRLAAPDPKSGVYTNFTTSACDCLTRVEL